MFAVFRAVWQSLCESIGHSFLSKALIDVSSSGDAFDDFCTSVGLTTKTAAPSHICSHNYKLARPNSIQCPKYKKQTKWTTNNAENPTNSQCKNQIKNKKNPPFIAVLDLIV
jgi:hypothetical protein